MTAPEIQTEASAVGQALAYLVIVHHQPNHLARLIRALAAPGCFFFIHVDRKVALAPFQAAVAECRNVIFARDRVLVEWGKLSVVEAILSAVRTAAASGQAFRYLTVLSGSDYPIKHKREIHAHLRKSDRQFIRIDRRLTQEAGSSHGNVIKDLPGGKYFADFLPYHGSMFWSLTSDCMRYVLGFVESNPTYMDIHRHVFAPDEVFFHSLLKQSPFAAEIAQDFSDGIYPDHIHHGIHFIDWAGLRSRKNLILDERDFDDLQSSAALLARKFDEQQSSRLLMMLDDQVHGASRDFG